MNYLSVTTKQFIPTAQYLLAPFESEYLINSASKKAKATDDKLIPETEIALKIAKKHFETIEIKDRIVRESLDELAIYLGIHARTIAFPEFIVPIGVILRKFKKNTTSANHRKVVAAFMDTVQANSEFVLAKRAAFQEKSLKNLPQVVQNFDTAMKMEEVLPMEKMRSKVE